MVDRPHYASEAFPWVSIDSSLTVDGLLAHRATHQRQAWGRVLAGTDDQLVDAALRLKNLSPENNSMSEEEVELFYWACIRCGRAEHILLGHWIPQNELLSFFCEGLRAVGRKQV